MNKINVIYKNAQFQNMSNDNDLGENFEFASDFMLSGLLRKASISNSQINKVSSSKKKTEKRKPKAKSHFQLHPKRITNDSVLSLDECDIYHEQTMINTVINGHTLDVQEKIQIDEFYSDNITDQFILSSKPQIKFKDDHGIPPLNIQDQNESPSNKGTICNESSGRSDKVETDRDSARESVFCTKINSMLLKINTHLQEIRLLLEAGPAPIESPEDLAKREKRSVEFSSRLSRNYLYQLGRQIADLRKHIKPASSKLISHNLSINQRLINSHQIVLQALQAFVHYIPQSILPGIQNKLQEFLMQICELSRLSRKFRSMNKISTNCAILDEVDKSCKYLIQNFEEETNKNNEPLSDKTPKKSVKNSAAGGSQSSPTTMHKKQTIESRLSMYSVPLKRTPKGSNIWKKNAAMLAKQRFNVQSRYKPGTYNPKAAEKPVLHFPVKTSVVQKKSSEMKTTPVHSCINDDDIPTMVQIDMNNDKILETDDERRNAFLSATETEIKTRLEPLLQNLLTEMTTAKEEIMDHSSCDNVLDKLKGLLNQMQSLREQQQGASNDSPEAQNVIKIYSPEKSNMNKTEASTKSNIMVTGTKNVKLICIKDKSCFEVSNEDDCKKKYDEKYIVMENKVMQKDFEKIVNDNELKKVETLKERVYEKSHQAPIGQLPKKFAINIVQYKLEFHKYTKTNHMYRKTPLIQPWELTSKISDLLLQKLILSTIKEIELDKIISNVYRSEFV